jgi:hypothetical protein
MHLSFNGPNRSAAPNFFRIPCGEGERKSQPPEPLAAIVREAQQIVTRARESEA